MIYKSESFWKEKWIVKPFGKYSEFEIWFDPQSSKCAKFFSIFVQMNMMYELILAKKKVEEAALIEEQMASMSAASFKKVNKYEYDSDEDVEGGTWEHKNRNAEMEATRGKEQVFSLKIMKLWNIYHWSGFDVFVSKFDEFIICKPFSKVKAFEVQVSEENLNYILFFEKRNYSTW